ncbi:MAG: MFS transporter [Gammaproteobacteria bacterium]|nr:MFS transporter [Gammaproteobacteria bacterium]
MQIEKADKSDSFYSWLVWFLAAAFFFYKYLLQVSPSVMSDELMRSFHATGAQLGNLAACFFYSYLILQIPVGILLDRFNPKYITTAAILISAIGVYLFSEAITITDAYITRGIIGLGAAFAAVSCFKLITIWFPPKRFALLAGLSMTAGMFGAIGGQAPLSILVKNFDWQIAMKYIAVPGFMLAILFFLLVKERKFQRKDLNEPRPTLKTQLATVLKCKQTWILSFYSGLAFAPISVFGGLWGVSFLKQAYHLSPTAAASTISFIFVGFAIGCPISGWLSDHLQRRKPLMFIGTSLAIISLSVVLYLPQANATLLSILLLVFGLGASCFFLCFSMVREINSLMVAATVLGFMNTFDSVCEALSEPFIGKMLDFGWDGTLDHGARIFSLRDYHLSLSILVFYLIGALIFLFFTKETFCRQK